MPELASAQSPAWESQGRLDRAAAERIFSGEQLPAGGLGAVLAATARPAALAEMMP
jgi:hypothetical protein